MGGAGLPPSGSGPRGRTGRWPANPSTWPGTPPASVTATRCCPGTTSTLASTTTSCGRTRGAGSPGAPTPPTAGGGARPGADEGEDCRWRPSYDCGVLPSRGTEIQIGPTGERLPAGTRLL